MAYDPDLEPIFEQIDAQLDNHQAVLGDISARLKAVEERPPMDLSGIVARLDKLEAAKPAEPIPVVTPPVVEPPPVVVAPPAAPIWDSVKQTRISIPERIEVPAGQRDIYIPVTVDHTDRESFYCYVSGFSNISGGGINVGGSAQQKADFLGWHNVVYRWSPGDDLTHYIKITTRNTYAAGKTFRAMIRVKGLGDGQKGRGVDVVFTDGAQHPAMPPQFHRPLRRLDLSNAVRKNAFDPASVRWSPSGFDAGGGQIWRSQVAHGRTQDGNQETGLYADETVKGADNPISYDAAENAVRLHTRAFEEAERLEYQDRLFRHQAAILNGQTMDEVCGAEGVWRMEAKIPVRKYSWPAFWLCGRGETARKGSWASWPPEIDILEKFNFAWGGADTPFTTTFAQHFGNVGKNTRIGAFGNEIELDQWAGVTKPLDEDYHSWACAVTYADDPRKAEVTFFVDDVEVGRHVLFARHQDMETKFPFFPMVNVAVKANTTYTPEQYNTDDGRGRTGDMLIRDVAYFESGFTMPAVA